MIQNDPKAATSHAIRDATRRDTKNSPTHKKFPIAGESFPSNSRTADRHPSVRSYLHLAADDNQFPSDTAPPATSLRFNARVFRDSAFCRFIDRYFAAGRYSERVRRMGAQLAAHVGFGSSTVTPVIGWRGSNAPDSRHESA